MPEQRLLHHGPVSCIDRPTEPTIRAMLPGDGEMHVLLIDFRNAEGHPVARPALTFWADAAPEPPAQFMAEVARMAMPMAKGVGLWALAKASGFVDEAGGLKDAVGAVAGVVGGGARPARRRWR